MLDRIDQEEFNYPSVYDASVLCRRKRQRALAISKRMDSIARRSSGKNDSGRLIAFTFYVMALSARLACQGLTSPKNKQQIVAEIASLKEIFSIPENESAKIEGFYTDALHDTTPVSHYAMQIMNLFPNNRIIFEQLIDNLFLFSDADSPFNVKKVSFLKELVLAFHFNRNYFRTVLRKHRLVWHNDPFELLDVPKNVSFVMLKRRYRELIKDCHPDSVQAQEDVLAELKELANEQFSYYTRAYHAALDRRGFDHNGVKKRRFSLVK